MKYIRTKNGIYEVKTKMIFNHIKEYRLADTIDELCDCFVAIGKKHYIWDKQHCLGLTFEQVKQSYSAYDFEIYGAIWTDDGLIYVAKMNANGELELI